MKVSAMATCPQNLQPGCSTGDGGGSAPPTLHGGRLLAARALFPGAPEPFVDLSTGINPHPYQLPALSPDAFSRLPEPEDEAELCRLAAAAYGVPPASRVVAAPGSQILISLLPGMLRHSQAVLLGPTYGGHASSWAASGASVLEVADADALAAHAGPGVALVLCNPNNPDGRRLPLDRLAALASRCAAQGGALVVDEAFADLEPDVPQAAALLPSPGLVVLRSFGKSYGLAGVRLGFLLADPPLAERMRRLLGSWAVGGVAIAVGRRALADGCWRDRSGTALRAGADRLDRVLTEAGMVVEGGTRLFRLARCPDADAVFRRLGRSGLLVRRFEEQPGRLRFGLPPDEAAWMRLRAALPGG